MSLSTALEWAASPVRAVLLPASSFQSPTLTFVFLTLAVLLSFVFGGVAGRRPRRTTVPPRCGLDVRCALMRILFTRLEARMREQFLTTSDRLLCANHLAAGRRYAQQGEFGAASFSARVVARRLERLK